MVQLDPASDTILHSWPVPVGGGRGAANLALAGPTLYLTDPNRNTVAIIDTVSGRSDYFGAIGSIPGQFMTPVGIATSADGQVYVLDSDNLRIQIFNPLVPR